MTGGIASLALLALAAVVWGTARNHRDLLRWLGADPAAPGRSARAACWIAALALLGPAVLELGAPPARFAAGADVVLLVDVSRSMAARDVAPSRLRRATRFAERLVAQAGSARFGLVIFAGDAFAALPVSGDREIALAYLQAIDADVQSASGTDLARGLEQAARLLAQAGAGSGPAAIVVLSDGEHDASRAPRRLEAAVGELRGRGIRVASIAFGTAAGGVVLGAEGIPVLDRGGRPVVSRRRDGVLADVARDTRGVFLRELEDRPAPRDVLAAVLQPGGEPAATPAFLALLVFAALALELALALDRHRTQRAGRRAWIAALRPARGAARAAAGLARRPAPALLLALALLGAVPAGELLEGDRLLEAGDAESALSHYQRLERGAGVGAETRVRIGNALYRLGEYDRAASAYVDALRLLEPGASALRHVASFNLGNSLLELGRLDQAREAYWSAILEQPDDVEAKFNYELVLERMAASQPPPTPSPDPAQPPPESESQGEPSEDASADPERSRGGAAELSDDEAQRWLRSVGESLERPLREQLREALAPAIPLDPTGQTW